MVRRKAGHDELCLAIPSPITAGFAKMSSEYKYHAGEAAFACTAIEPNRDNHAEFYRGEQAAQGWPP